METLNEGLEVLKIGSFGDQASKLPGREAPNLQTSQEPLRLLAIEKELAGPDREAALAKHDAVLVGLGARLKAAMDAGLSPDEYESAKSLSEATTVARKILRLYARAGGDL